MAKSEEEKIKKEKVTVEKKQSKKVDKKTNTNKMSKKDTLKKEASKQNTDTKKVLETKKNNINEKQIKEDSQKVTSFKTSEVVFLVIITCIISLIMGFVVCYSLNDKNIISSKDNNLQEFIKNYENVTKNYYKEVDKEKLIDGAIAGMLGQLDDQYTGLINSENQAKFNRQLAGEYLGLGIEVANNGDNNIEIVSVFENSGAKKAGIQVGDIIYSIDGKNMLGLKTTELVNHVDGNKDAYDFIVLRNNEQIKSSIEYGKVTIQSVTSKIIEKNNKQIGYIYIGIFSKITDEQFKEQLKELEKQGMDSLIIDVRCNTGGHLTTAVNIISTFVDKDTVIYQTDKKGEITKFYSNEKGKKTYPIVVLQDGCSASASEMLSAALKEQYGATIIGTTSYGKGTIQELVSFNSNSEYKYTTKKWLTSKGEWINEKGVTPNITVQLSEEYTNNPSDDTDNQLQKAISTLIEK